MKKSLERLFLSTALFSLLLSSFLQFAPLLTQVNAVTDKCPDGGTKYDAASGSEEINGVTIEWSGHTVTVSGGEATFCVKASNDAGEKVTIENDSWDVDFLNQGGQIPNISHLVVYDAQTVTYIDVCRETNTGWEVVTIKDSERTDADKDANDAMCDNVTPVTPLQLTSVCSDDPSQTRQWRVRNTNNFSVNFRWEVVGTAYTGNETAPAAGNGVIKYDGATDGADYMFFETPTVGGANTVKIYWMDENDVEQSTVKASSGEQCEKEVQEVAPLKLTSMCWEDTSTHKLRVRNSNSFSVDYQYQVYSNPWSDFMTALTGDTYFTINGIYGQANTTKIRWMDENSTWKTTTKAVNQTMCETPEEPKEFEVCRFVEGEWEIVTTTQKLEGDEPANSEKCDSGGNTNPTPTPTPTSEPTPTPTPGTEDGRRVDFGKVGPTCEDTDIRAVYTAFLNDNPVEGVKVNFDYVGKILSATTGSNGRASVTFGYSGAGDIVATASDSYPGGTVGIEELDCEDNNSGEVLGTSTAAVGGGVMGDSTEESNGTGGGQILGATSMADTGVVENIIMDSMGVLGLFSTLAGSLVYAKKREE